MKKFDLFKDLCLHEEDGWDYLPFIDQKQKSFYNYMLENMETTLAWVAVRKSITEKDLIKHHLIRNQYEADGLINSLPRLLIVTDKKRWFISTLACEKFKSVRYTQVLTVICENVKIILKYYNKINASQERVHAMIKSIERLKAEVRKYGENIAEYGPEDEIDLFSGSGTTISEKHKHWPDMVSVSKKIQENPIQSLSAEAASLSKILHEVMFDLVNINQLEFLLKFTNLELYVNPWFKGNKLIMCLTKVPLMGNKKNTNQRCMYLIVDKSGRAKPYKYLIQDIEKEIKPGLFKLDTKLVIEHLNKYPF